MAQRIILDAFDMSRVTHQAPGLWRHPDYGATRRPPTELEQT